MRSVETYTHIRFDMLYTEVKQSKIYFTPIQNQERGNIFTTYKLQKLSMLYMYQRFRTGKRRHKHRKR